MAKPRRDQGIAKTLCDAQPHRALNSADLTGDFSLYGIHGVFYLLDLLEQPLTGGGQPVASARSVEQARAQSLLQSPQASPYRRRVLFKSVRGGIQIALSCDCQENSKVVPVRIVQIQKFLALMTSTERSYQ